MRKRTRAREAAVQVLYQLDLLGAEALDRVDAELERLLAPAETDPSARQFARDLVTGCWEHKSELDARICSVAKNWALGRMAIVDRSILRLASYELLFPTDVPPKVAINEAIDLAKRFGGADSGAFVNGILDRIRADSETSKKSEG